MTEEKDIREEFTPLADRIFCEMIPETTQIADGIIIPDSAQNKPRKALVISVGDGHMTPEGELIPLRVKAGDKVLLPEVCGTPLNNIGDVEFRLINERDCLGLIG